MEMTRMTLHNHHGAKTGLLVGYLALAVGLFVAHGDPATGYELSVYTATPLTTWIGVGLAVATGVAAVFLVEREQRTHDAGLLLVAMAMLTTITMPILRGYTYYGTGDALSHIGWAREIASGSLPAGDLLYPGIHTATVVVGAVADISLLQANLYVILLAFPLVFILFVPLLVQLLARTTWAYPVGLFVAVLFTPLNNIATHPVAHPSSQAILFSAVAFFLALAYTVRAPDGPPATWRAWLASRPTGLGILLVIVTVALLFVHPQQALNLSLCFAAIAGIQLLVQYRSETHSLGKYRPLHIHAVAASVAFLAWAPRFERVRGAVVSTVLSIITGGPTTGTVVGDKSLSITTLGGSLPSLFAKLFFSASVLSLVAAVVILWALSGRFEDRETNVLATYLTAALVPATAVFLVVFAAATGDMYFRYHGFIMVSVAVLGAVGLALALGRTETGGGGTVPKVAVAILLVTMLPFGFAFLHPSPAIYQPSQHVADSQISGYSASFEHREAGVAFAGIRGGPVRYVDLHYGTQQARMRLGFPGYESAIPPAVFASGNYTDYYDNDRYIATTAPTKEKEVGLYEGFRYSEAGFRNFEHSPGVSRIRTSDGFDLYRVDGGDES